MLQKLFNYQIIKLSKDSQIVANPIFLGNSSEDIRVANMKTTRLYVSVSDFSFD